MVLSGCRGRVACLWAPYGLRRCFLYKCISLQLVRHVWPFKSFCSLCGAHRLLNWFTVGAASPVDPVRLPGGSCADPLQIRSGLVTCPAVVTLSGDPVRRSCPGVCQCVRRILSVCRRFVRRDMLPRVRSIYPAGLAVRDTGGAASMPPAVSILSGCSMSGARRSMRARGRSDPAAGVRF